MINIEDNYNKIYNKAENDYDKLIEKTKNKILQEFKYKIGDQILIYSKLSRNVYSGKILNIKAEKIFDEAFLYQWVMTVILKDSQFMTFFESEKDEIIIDN